MESCKAASSSVGNSSSSEKQRFIFNITKDINLLESAFGINPFQLGKAKWADVSADLKEKYGYVVSARTVRDRINTLVRKFKQDELKTKTGTEEEKSRRGQLLSEIIVITESEEAAINIEIGANENDENEDEILLTPKKKRINERKAADEERDEVFRLHKDTPSEPYGIRKKRSKTSEEDLVAMKLKHDIDLENRRFEFEAMLKRTEQQNEDKRIEIELAREKRLAEEALANQELLRNMQQTIHTILEMVKKN